MAKAKKGFAVMSPEKRREIASLGGQASPANFARLPKERVQEIGRKGGKKSRGGGRKPKEVKLEFN